MLLMAIKNVYRAFCRKRGKALTTGFINIALNAGAHFSEYRNLRIPLMLLPTIFNRVRVSLRGGYVAEGVLSDLADNLRVTITDAKGIELLSFRLASGDRYILSTQNGSVTNRKLSRDDLYWSKDTIMEVVREMGSNN